MRTQPERAIEPTPNDEAFVMRYREWKHRARGGRAAAALLVTWLSIGATACDSLLEADIPGRVEESALNDPALATTLVNSALGQFECAYGNYVATVGVLTEE
jgi:hypothetical protein